MKNYLAPKLSNSNFSYRDLFYDPSEGKVSMQLNMCQLLLYILRIIKYDFFALENILDKL